ncbi:MAG: ribosomal-processing cysteine protease Prp [Clostridiales bacterium]|nr:ribosomal-processing cysteine protease Prp [Clostridiales bacterium]
MTKVVFFKEGDNYYGFREYGHAGFEEAGKDIICAALSAMTMLIINTIEVVWGSDVDYEIDDETADITVKAKEALPDFAESEEKQFAISGLFYSYYLQLNDMLEDYYDYLDVDVEEKPYGSDEVE